MRFATLLEIDDAGHDVRVWCFRCARGGVVIYGAWARFGQLDLTQAAHRFRCKGCRRSDEVLVVPATRPKQPSITGVEFVAAYFHAMRKARKRR